MERKRKSLILIVDDNKELLYNLQLMLETNRFKVITASNGKKALEILENNPILPDLIISDIIMPEMSGYEFFKAVSSNPQWYHIPFLFLTAKSSEEEIRFGKLLGVDDYIVKPFKKKDLLAIINGKLNKLKRAELITENFSKSIKKLSDIIKPSLQNKSKKKDVILFLIYWDDVYGPKLVSWYPSGKKNREYIENIGIQLFQTSVFLYGQEKITKPEGILLNVKKMGKMSYLLFDSYYEEKKRGKQQQYMLALLVPKINYLESLRVKKLFIDISEEIKNKNQWNIEETWNEIIKILSERTLNL
ncbi:MAG: response regulator [Promethearchaeota archaeon]